MSVLGQIRNGGIDQYFTNSYGKYAQDTLIAYKTIGAEKLAIALAVAMASFHGGKYPKDHKAYIDIIVKLPDHRIIFPQNVDNTFYLEIIIHSSRKYSFAKEFGLPNTNYQCTHEKANIPLSKDMEKNHG